MDLIKYFAVGLIVTIVYLVLIKVLVKQSTSRPYSIPRNFILGILEDAADNIDSEEYLLYASSLLLLFLWPIIIPILFLILLLFIVTRFLDRIFKL